MPSFTKAANWRDRLVELLRDRLLERLGLTGEALSAYVERIAAREVDPYTVVEEIIGASGLGRGK